MGARPTWRMTGRVSALALLLLSCDGTSTTLVADLRTDLVAGIEFDEIEVRLDGGPPMTRAVNRGDDYVGGLRVGEWSGLDTGTHRIEVRLLRVDALVASRPTAVNLQASTAVTILITRNCAGVECPAGGDPLATACLDGMCVPEECTPETPATCPPPGCTMATECTDGDACALPRCDPGGVCLYASGDSCAAAEYCDPDVGCRAVPSGTAPPPVLLRFPWNGYARGSVHRPSPLAQAFQWEPSAGAGVYEIEVDDECAIETFRSCVFPSVDAAASPTTTTASISSLPVSTSPPVGDRYYWRVRACTEVGGACSAWSEVRYFDLGRQPTDFDGDGYADIAIASLASMSPEAVYVYRGGATVSDTPAWTLDNPAAAGSRFGQSLAAGDLDGDGYGDLVVGASARSNPEIGEGAVYVYRGGPTGLSATPTVEIDNPQDQMAAQLGWALAVGDTDGDGYRDIVAGAPSATDTVMSSGGLFVFGGTSSGVSDIARAQRFGDAAGAGYGTSLSAEGDLDGDGLVDVAVGTDTFTEAGGVFVHSGDRGDEGIAAGATTIPNPLAPMGTRFGVAVAIGRFAEGPFAHLAVGAPEADVGGQTGEGVIYYFRGSADGIGTARENLVDNPADHPGGSFGATLRVVGDVDDDGIDDLFVGAPLQDAGSLAEGNTFLFAGGRGFSTSPAFTLDSPTGQMGAFFSELGGVGDVNGDGFDDMVVGASGTNMSGGEAYLYLSSVVGPEAVPDVTFTPPGGVGDEAFGFAIAD